ncbi:MAG: hypothetical protein LQ349_000636 [Xanthoria aureola]|nr:MAG: hypothetical protein LQ349_000636 [Xanthoria aureola]
MPYEGQLTVEGSGTKCVKEKEKRVEKMQSVEHTLGQRCSSGRRRAGQREQDNWTQLELHWAASGRGDSWEAEVTSLTSQDARTVEWRRKE